MISNMCLKLKHSHVLIIVIMSFLFQCVNSTTTTPAFLGNQLVPVAEIKCNDKERNALLGFKAMILGDPYDRLSTWGTKKEDVDDDDCCKWMGVKCNNQTGHVTELHLCFGSLEGEISPSLLNLTHLTYFCLGDNSFYGVIPKSIGSLIELRYLYLYNNSFNGTIPKSIGSLSKLEHLYLSSNSFSGSIPNSIGSLTELRELFLDNNFFSGTIPGSIGSLTELTYLDLSANSFSGIIPPEFGNLVNLKSLILKDLGRCSVENITWLSRLSHLEFLFMSEISLAKADHWVNAILSLQKLTGLRLDGCDLSQVMHPYSTSSVNSSSSSSSNISILSLRDNNLNSSMYPWLYPLNRNISLVSLDLSGNKLDEIPKYFGNLCSLIRLDFTNNSALVTFSDFLKPLSAGCTSNTLMSLDASGSQFTGSISDDIQNFSSLTELNLAHNQLNGTISEKMWELPMLETLNISFNSLRGAIFGKTGKSTLEYMYLSNNLLQGVPSTAHISNLSYVEHIDLSFCKLGPRFPKWIQTFKNLNYLNLANNGISDTIPVEFWNLLPSQMEYLNLSSNNISGRAPDFNTLTTLDLSSNNFCSPVVNVSSTLSLLNLSKNRFYGGISFLCQNVEWSLTYLDLSYNSFSGKIPDCLWHLKKLKVLNLAYNNLSGRLPASVEYLFQLEVLYLYNNNFSGELPLSLRNCTMLTFLDLGANRFSGNVPVWIGQNLSGLYVLNLGTNNFFGSIPLQVCQLVNLQILDLSMNNLNGTIPSCVNNLTSMVHEGFLSAQNVHEYKFNVNGSRRISWDYADHEMIKWQGSIREFTSNIILLRSIDLSSNNLTGEIPNELTDLHGLLALNLSKNALLGGIPYKIGQMKEILILDLSGNNLSGRLPSTMSQLNFLNYLDVSYNNLTGRIPRSTQLQSFGPSRYIGNAGLCGPPLLTKSCPGDEELHVPSSVDEREGNDEGNIDELERWFYIGGAIGFAVGFWIVCGTLLVNRRGRHTFFHFMNILEDWVYVKVLVSKARFQRAAHE